MNVQKERKSTFFIAFERRKKKLAACLLPNIDIAFVPECLCRLFFVVWASFYCPLLGRTRSRGRCWAAIRFFYRPEPSVHGEVEELDIRGQHGRRFVLLHHIYRLQRKP